MSEEAEGREDRQRRLPPSASWIVTAIAVAMSAFHIWALGFTVLSPWILTSLHLMFATVLVFLLYPAFRGGGRWLDGLDVAFALLAVATYLYVLYDYRELLMRAGSFPNTPDLVFGTAAILMTLEITRRTTGLPLPIVAIAALAYGYFGDLLPGMFGHRGYGVERIVSLVYSMDGIFSTALQVSATYIFLFVLFGAFLQTSGAGDFFLKLALGAVGAIRGGPAKVAVLASALFGTISGSAVANTAGTGAVTIPMMKRIGYRPHFAAAVEAVASTGGQIMPPIMGAGAFIIADIVGVSYWEVALAAVIPALLYFVTVVIGIDIEAQKTSLRGMPKDQLPPALAVMRESGHLLIPIVVLLVSLSVLLVSPIRAALYALAAMVAVSFVRAHTRMGPRKLIEAMASGAKASLDVVAACATAGIVVGILNLTGLGQTIAAIIIELSQGQVLVALVLAMLVCILLGMGLPTTPAYIIAASVVAPALIRMGLPPLQTHLFVFYFACIAVITPPVALASFTAAGIAGAPPMKVGMTGVKLGVAAFLIPYLFVYNPALIGHADALRVALAVISALIGVFGLASAIFGYFMGPLSLITRAVLLVGALLLIKPGLLTDGVGLALLAIGFGWRFFAARRQQGAAPTHEQLERSS
jgi:TRAP transporter 4TM/12TM fusion protein